MRAGVFVDWDFDFANNLEILLVIIFGIVIF